MYIKYYVRVHNEKITKNVMTICKAFKYLFTHRKLQFKFSFAFFLRSFVSFSVKASQFSGEYLHMHAYTHVSFNNIKRFKC